MKRLVYFFIFILVLFGIFRGQIEEKFNPKEDELVVIDTLRSEPQNPQADTLILSEIELKWFEENGLSELPKSLSVNQQLAFRDFLQADNQEDKLIRKYLDSLKRLNPELANVNLELLKDDK